MALFQCVGKRFGEEVWVERGTDIFKRGHDLDKETCRRLRDMLIAQLRGLGMRTPDIARVVSMRVSERQVRNRLAATPFSDDVRVAMAKVILKAQQEVEKDANVAKASDQPVTPDAEAKRPARRRRTARRPEATSQPDSQE
jgi:hypothetical protein